MRHRYLLARSHGQTYALPLASALETMRPLPADPVEGAPDGLLGLSLVRGRPTPVLDLSRLMAGRATGCPGRYVTLRSPHGPVALAVEEVLGIREIPESSLETVPGLLTGANERIRRIGLLDGQLLYLLEAVRIVPDEVLPFLPGEGA